MQKGKSIIFKKSYNLFQNNINKKSIFIFALAVFAIGSVTPGSFAYAENIQQFSDSITLETSSSTSTEQNNLDAITDIEFRTVTDFHTYLPNTQLRFDVSCNELAGEFAIGYNTFLQKSNGDSADVNDVRNFIFLQKGSSETGALIDAVNTGSNTLKLTAEVTCAKLLPESLPTVPYTPTEFVVITGENQATVSWEEPIFDGNSIISKYELSAMPDPKTSSSFDVFVDTEDLEFTFDGLVNGITYKFQVNAVNEIGSGIKSEILTGTTFEVAVPTPTPTPNPLPIPTSNEKITLCHNDKVTLYLPSQAIDTHLNNHGDYLGECTENFSISNKEHKEADRLAKQEAKKLQLESDKAQREADRLAQQEADKAQKQADRLSQQEADKAQKQADRLSQQEAKRIQLEEKQAKKLTN
ncbi:MAG: fibronectin type III domain-containing protein [Nitrosopumilus sp.]|nr:fibronectin type III domain-containing protein [Nitrosopumilus sp.]